MINLDFFSMLMVVVFGMIYDAGTWKSYSGITKYELNANILIIKDSYFSGDETDWQTCKRFKIVSIKGNTMICTVCLMDEGDTELTFTKR